MCCVHMESPQQVDVCNSYSFGVLYFIECADTIYSTALVKNILVFSVLHTLHSYL